MFRQSRSIRLAGRGKPVVIPLPYLKAAVAWKNRAHSIRSFGPDEGLASHDSSGASQLCAGTLHLVSLLSTRLPKTLRAHMLFPVCCLPVPDFQVIPGDLSHGEYSWLKALRYSRNLKSF